MKKILIAILFLFYCMELSAQWFYPSDIYYGRQPSAKAEAMGRGMVANPSNEFASFYNPASSSFTDGVELSISFSQKYFGDNMANFNFEGLSYDLRQGRGSIGISRYYLGTGFNYNRGDNFNYTIYAANYSRNFGNGFHAGANLNFINAHIPGDQYYLSNILPENVTSASIDIGTIKTFNLPERNAVRQMITVGASVTNVTFTVLQHYFLGRVNLPVLLRAGGAYNVRFSSGLIPTLNLLVHGEIEKELRNDNLDVLKAGAEAIIYEILALRGGFYSNWYSGGSKRNYYTYGVGLNIPVNKFTHGDYPFKITVDYVNMKQPSSYDYGNFNLLSMKINWIPD